MCERVRQLGLLHVSTHYTAHFEDNNGQFGTGSKGGCRKERQAIHLS